MKTIYINRCVCILCTAVLTYSCVPNITLREVNTNALPNTYTVGHTDTLNSASTSWRSYFNDQNLIALIDTALQNNQELLLFSQELQLEINEVRARKGEYLPFVNIGAGAEVDKVGRYTRSGALEATTDIEPHKEFPEPFGNYRIGAIAS